ncbi:hypothetical protein [Halorhabdus sp. BNX81]|uniref:hypothetical protein n=1 Tax=Halorhabdus sp. BNX81 TaxID=2980181 RepID=UPI0023DCEF40|nr:hypothetical protein [Halorhabdus sp. BNX81]
MAMEVIEETDWYRIEYDDDLDALIHTWTMFSNGEQFREGANALYEALKEYDVSKEIIDTREVKAHDEEDKQWLQEEWIPKMVDAGMEYSANVHRESVIAEMDMQETVDPLSDLPFENMMTDDMAEAREWIAEQ